MLIIIHNIHNIHNIILININKNFIILINRFECNCADVVNLIAHVKGKIYKRIWIANGDIILVSLRDFEPEKWDVVEKYREKEVSKLKKVGEIPDSMVLPSSSNDDEEKEEAKDEYYFLRSRK